MKDSNDDVRGGCIDLEWWCKMGCIDPQWWWCRYLSTPSADASRKYTSSDTTERMNTQKTCEFGSYFRLTVIFSSQHNFTHMKQIQNCIFYQYFASPSLTRDQFACPVFCLQTRIFCHKIYYGLQTRIFCYKNIFCLPTTFADECFCLQAEIFFSKFCLSANSKIGDEYCCL